MVHNPVSEVGCKYFPFYGFVYNKGNGPAGLICTVVYFFTKFNEITLIIYFEFNCIGSISFVFATVNICLKQIGQLNLGFWYVVEK